MKCLVYTSHLYGLGGGARAALWIAKAMSHFMPTTICYSLSPSAEVLDWLRPDLGPNLALAPYSKGMETSFDTIWNVDHWRYLPPAGKRNLAFIFFPRFDNVPPPQYTVYGVSQYSARYVEELWQRPCETLYLPVEAGECVRPKRKMILNVSRFARPSEYADKGHREMIDAFKLIHDAHPHWEMLFVGGLDPGQGSYLDALTGAARNYPIRFMVNAPQDVVERAYAEAAIYWHPTGISMPNEPMAQEHYGLSIMEAMHYGCVPISIRRGGPSELIHDQYDGLLFDEPQKLFALTEALIAYPSTWSLLSQRARALAVPFGDWGGFLNRMEALLSEQHISTFPQPKTLRHFCGPEAVCVVIPVHNQMIYTERCLERLWASANGVKVILVDNASTDDTPSLQGAIEDHGGVYLRREVNDGYAASNMAALPHCDRDYVLMLNNDVESLDGQWLEILLSEMRDPEVGIVGPKLLFPDGKIQSAGTAYDKSKPELFYHLGYGQPDEPCWNERQTPIAVTGACLLCRRELFDLDPTMTLNYEDVAMCLRARQKGFEIVYQPASYLFHYEARTKVAIDDTEKRIETSKLAFMRTYGGFL